MGKLLLAILILSWNCYNTSKKDIKVQGVKVSQIYPVLNNAGKIIRYDTSVVKIFFDKDYTLYELVYGFDSVVNQQLKLSEDRYHVLIHPRGSVFAYDYDQHKIPNIRKVPMDSVRKVEWVNNIKIYPIIFTQSTATLISSEKSTNIRVWTEKYYLKGKTEMDITGYCVLKYTDNLSPAEFTLSKELDSIKQKKLIEVNIESLPRAIKSTGNTLERMEVSYILERITKSSLDVKALYKKIVTSK